MANNIAPWSSSGGLKNKFEYKKPGIDAFFLGLAGFRL
jgi:hypothetical protein